ncbi:MAG: ribulokinase [Lachnospiraceae bacterium]|nr:ribulokinase [Lachnospiraceae bacterium]
MDNKYVIGLDYGTLSGRGVLVRCKDGKVLASAVKPYEHGEMTESLPCGSKLPVSWCLEYPRDYTDVMEYVVKEIMKESHIEKEDVIGIGIDFTSCTMLPVDEKNEPLCEKVEFKKVRNAYVKVWKHHAAQKQADRINEYLIQKDLMQDYRFGGKISSELMVPKVMEILEEDPEIYRRADKIVEAGDWLTMLLTGEEKRSCSMAGYKMWWNNETGYPDKNFFSEITPHLKNFVGEKLKGEVCCIGEKIGTLTDGWADRLGLNSGIAVSPTVIDSHAGMPGSAIARKGQMMMVLGTSSVLLALSDNPFSGKGIMGNVKSGIVPDYYALESGLAAVGDLFGWFIDNMLPAKYVREADEKKVNVYNLLNEKAEKLRPGESGLLALDWWNGNKTPYVDGNLSGSIIGMTLKTKPEEIYRALIEATAFGTRMIKELFEENGVEIHEIIASGGICEKNPFVMQIYADVLGIDIKIAESDQTAALGSAVYAALAAGKAAGGYDSYEKAVMNMSSVKEQEYHAIKSNQEQYNILYQTYCDYNKRMGMDGDRQNVLKRLHTIKENNCHEKRE